MLETIIFISHPFFGFLISRFLFFVISSDTTVEKLSPEQSVICLRPMESPIVNHSDTLRPAASLVDSLNAW